MYDAGERAEQILNIAQSTSIPEPDKKAQIRNLIDPPTPGSPTHDFIWKAFIVGVVAICVIAVLGLLLLLWDDNGGADKALTVFTTAFAGLIGLFVKSPQQN